MDRYKHIFIWHNCNQIEAEISLIGDDPCKYCNRTVFMMSASDRIAPEERENLDRFMNEKFPCLTENEYIIKKLLE